MKTFLVSFGLIFVPFLVFPQLIVRGPYLQLRTQHSIQIRYRTDQNIETRVKYGLSSKNLNNEVVISSNTYDHLANISGLASNSKYFYAIYNNTQKLEGSNVNFFITTQEPNSPQKIRFWATGDCVTPLPVKMAVKNSFLNYVGENYIDSWILLGDNAYNTGLDYEYQNNYFLPYQSDRIMKQTNIYPVPGNHDYYATANAKYDHIIPYYDIFSSAGNGILGGVPSNHKEYYAYDIGNVHFIALDSYGLETANNWALADTLSPQVVWLKQDLAANSKKWTIVYFHHPPYTMGTHNSDTELDLVAIRERLVPILERFNVDLVLTAHSHNYERSKMIKGHFGLENTFSPSAHLVSTSSGYYDGSFDSCPYQKKSNGTIKGTVYAVSGSSAEILYHQTSFPHEALPFVEPDFGGSVYMEIENNRLDFKMIGQNGDIRDKFTMVKDMNQKNAIDFVANVSSFELKSPYLEPSNWVSSAGVVPSISVSNPVDGMVFHVEDTKGCFKDTLILNAVGPCITSQTVDSFIEPSSVIILKTSNQIIGSSIISPNTNINFDAKKSVELLPGFETKVGTIFKAQIGGCENIPLN
ncbi:metallophosphoesterase family protein [Lacihabitans sp. LS3-19]|uniref:purple acid phosphatase family protein n=1 Tax=Lacihabitans sp. LS3-19 TaxID=2487335 RepID=UPI0020CE15FF|nr:metallophosphoesterase family protein [Lacihabitans sp. LS3-19]MCP9766886.1 metallophosphoesterase family protein [Lacihabitans sp. LS3-19]